MIPNKLLFPEGNFITLPFIGILNRFPNIASDQEIHSGWPHIKNTRILASDVFRANVIKGYTLEQISLDFKQMGISVSCEVLNEAVKFTIALLNYVTNEKKTTETKR